MCVCVSVVNVLQVSASFVNEDVEGAALWFDGKQQWMDGDWKIGQASSARRGNGPAVTN